MEDHVLLTLPGVARKLFISQSAVKRLIKSGKLEAVKNGRETLILPESVNQYLQRQPHPRALTSTMYYCRNTLAYKRSMELQMPLESLEGAPREYSPFELNYLQKLYPLMEEFLEVLKVKDYNRAEEIRHEMWRVGVDYYTLYEPFSYNAMNRTYKSPEWAQDKFFEE